MEELGRIKCGRVYIFFGYCPKSDGLYFGRVVSLVFVLAFQGYGCDRADHVPIETSVEIIVCRKFRANKKGITLKVKMKS